jgi:hypothetical protein
MAVAEPGRGPGRHAAVAAVVDDRAALVDGIGDHLGGGLVRRDGVELIDVRVGEAQQVCADVLDVLVVSLAVVTDAGALTRADADALGVPGGAGRRITLVLDELRDLQVDLARVLGRQAADEDVRVRVGAIDERIHRIGRGAAVRQRRDLGRIADEQHEGQIVGVVVGLDVVLELRGGRADLGLGHERRLDAHLVLPRDEGHHVGDPGIVGDDQHLADLVDRRVAIPAAIEEVRAVDLAERGVDLRGRRHAVDHVGPAQPHRHDLHHDAVIDAQRVGNGVVLHRVHEHGQPAEVAQDVRLPAGGDRLRPPGVRLIGRAEPEGNRGRIFSPQKIALRRCHVDVLEIAVRGAHHPHVHLGVVRDDHAARDRGQLRQARLQEVALLTQRHPLVSAAFDLDRVEVEPGESVFEPDDVARQFRHLDVDDPAGGGCASQGDERGSPRQGGSDQQHQGREREGSSEAVASMHDCLLSPPSLGHGERLRPRSGMHRSPAP